MVNALTMFYGSQQSSTFEGRKNIASSLIDSDNMTKEVMQFFFEEFQVQIKHLQDQCNKEIKKLVKEGKIKNPDTHKVYQALYLGKDSHPSLLRFFKFSMVVPPILSEGFQYLHCHQRNKETV